MYKSLRYEMPLHPYWERPHQVERKKMKQTHRGKVKQRLKVALTEIDNENLVICDKQKKFYNI